MADSASSRRQMIMSSPAASNTACGISSTWRPVNSASRCVGKSSGVEEVGVVDHANGKPGPTPGQVIVRVDPRYFRPSEVESLLGDPTKARQKLGWSPKISFRALVTEMVREDLKSAERDALIKRHGYSAHGHHE